MKNNDKIFWGFICLIILLLLFWHFYRKHELRTNNILLTCRIIDIASTNKSSPVFECEIFYDGNKKIVSSTTNAQKRNLFVGKYFPLVYSNKINSGQILIAPKDFEEYGIPFPDSLKWVLPYVNY